MAEEPIHEVVFQMQQLSTTHSPRVIPLNNSGERMGTLGTLFGA